MNEAAVALILEALLKKDSTPSPFRHMVSLLTQRSQSDGSVLKHRASRASSTHILPRSRFTHCSYHAHVPCLARVDAAHPSRAPPARNLHPACPKQYSHRLPLLPAARLPTARSLGLR